MVKIHYTDHHHRWYFNEHIDLVCEYCTVECDGQEAYNLHIDMRDTFGIDSTGGQNINQAIGDYLWEEKEKGPFQPAVDVSALHSCMVQSCSTEEIDQLQRGGHLASALSEDQISQGNQGLGYIQSQSEQHIDYLIYPQIYGKAQLALQTQYAPPILEEQHRTELVSKLYPLVWADTGYSLKKIKELVAWYPTQQLEYLWDLYKP